MENQETKKQFRITLFEDVILITTTTCNNAAFREEIKLTEGKSMLLVDKLGWKHDWIETADSALNYYECCGVLILFGIIPPSFSNLCKSLRITE